MGAPWAFQTIGRTRLQMIPVNSEAPLETAPPRRPGSEYPNDDKPAICMGSDGTEYYRNGDVARVDQADSRARFFTDFHAIACSIGDDSTLYFLGGNDQEKWLRTYNPTRALKWTRSTDEFRSPLAIARDGTVYMVSMPRSGNLTLRAYGADGVARWHADLGGFEWNPVPPAIGPDGSIYVYNGVRSEPEVIAFTVQGEKQWSALVPAAVSKLVIASDGRVLVDVPAGHVIAFDREGHPLWNFYSGGGTTQGDGLVVAPDGTVYFASRFLYALDNQGKAKWIFKSELTYTQGDHFEEDPVIAEDGTIYASSFEHRLYAITPDGRKKWVFQGNVAGLPDYLALSDNGILRTQSGWFAVTSGLATHGWPSANHDTRNSRSAEAQ
jgi:outer membrane protein assembly factor BamB